MFISMGAQPIAPPRQRRRSASLRGLFYTLSAAQRGDWITAAGPAEYARFLAAWPNRASMWRFLSESCVKPV